jgi:hypothetical protein|tara:strand:- start:319 stop:492 length:174 start_codon:yes stop_codon:yes gene_type:complete
MTKKLETRLDKVEKVLDIIQNNHLKHLQKDLTLVKGIMLLTAAGVLGQLAIVVLRVF